MEKISLKTKWVSTDGWRGYQQPITAVAGANNTDMFSDSPCPTNVCLSELAMVEKELRKLKIPFRTKVCQSSNVFCVHHYLCVADEHRAKALEIVRSLKESTRLLYSCE